MTSIQRETLRVVSVAVVLDQGHPLVELQVFGSLPSWRLRKRRNFRQEALL